MGFCIRYPMWFSILPVWNFNNFNTKTVSFMTRGVTGTLKALNRKYERCESIMNVLSREHQG